jgi:nitrite reductase (NADH) large subunit
MTCYSRPRLPEVIAGKADPEQICLHPETWYAQRRIELLLGRKAVRLDCGAKFVQLEDGSTVPYTRLILAVGADSYWPPLEGLTGSRVFALRSLEDALAIREQAMACKSALLIGGGLLGLEAGYALTSLGLRVKVVEAAPRLLPRQVDEEGSQVLAAQLQALGFDFILGAEPKRLENLDGRICLYLADGRQADAELALISAGINPRVELARNAGLTVRRGIVVDEGLRTSAPDVWAAGDAAEWNGQITGLWPAAQAMGRIAGLNADGGQERYSGWIPSTKLKVAGIDLWSQGNIDPNGARIFTRRGSDHDFLVKLFVRNDKLAGSIQIGKAAGALQLKRVIEKQLPVAGFEEAMLSDNFDFNRIPGFA